MARETVASLKEQLKAAEVRHEAREKNLGEQITALKANGPDAERTRLQAENRALITERDALLSENNQLRDKLMEADRELARRAGYMEAIEDAKPPRLVEQPREAIKYEARDDFVCTPGEDRWGTGPVRKWWHR